MDPIIAKASEAKTSSQNTEVAAGLLQKPGKQRGKGAGKSKLGPAELTGLSTFAAMLQQASGESAPGTAKDFLPVGEQTVSTGKSPGKAGNRKMAVLADGQVPVDGNGGLNLYALLTGLGVEKDQAENIVREMEGELSLSAEASDKEKGVAGEKIAALLQGYGFPDEKIQGLLSALADSKIVPARSLPRQQGKPKETGNVLDRAAQAGSKSGEVALGLPGEKFFIPPNGRETKEVKEDGTAIKAAPGAKGSMLPARPVHAPAAGSGMAREGETAGGRYASSAMDGDQGSATRQAAPADTGGTAAVKQGGVFPLREGLAGKEPLQINVALPVTEAGAEKKAVIGEKSLTAGKDVPPEGKDTKNAPIDPKQRSAAFKERIDGAQRNREEQGGLLDEKMATGKKGGDAQMEMDGKKVREGDASDRIMTVREHGGTAGENTVAGKAVAQGNFPPLSGGINDVGAGTGPGLRPEAVINQIVANAGQFAQNSPGRIKITLTPPHLGTLDMDVLIRNNKVEVVMIASSQEVQQVLRAHGDQLKNALQGQGLKVEGFDVMLQGNQAGPGYRFRERSFTHDGRGEGGGSKEGTEAALSPSGIVSSPPGQGIANGDGISLFV